MHSLSIPQETTPAALSHSSRVMHCSRMAQQTEFTSEEVNLHQSKTQTMEGQVRPSGFVIMQFSSCNSISLALPYIRHSQYGILGLSDWPKVKLQPQLSTLSHYFPPRIASKEFAVFFVSITRAKIQQTFESQSL